MRDEAPAPAIAVIDNHDSFVFTIVGYLRALGATVSVTRNDDPAAVDRARAADGVLLSPGPGHPRTAGATLAAVAACASDARPLLGICLGHQAIAHYFGAQVAHAPTIMHGRVSRIAHDGRGVFAGLPDPMIATRYHSLAVASDSIPDALEVSATALPQGYDPHRVVMGLRHRELPLEGVQFHPEAVLTEGGADLLANWLAMVRARA
ncbi:anthranilate synthase component II [Rarobacter incanus]|uniref:Para-aminobenzoate synthetase component 2 n=1 Tax=Rarobacter incanus TaxID=153494 RepID=A0A542SPW1_9MICO|nr:aminodeoxychorismate/anthranilate synthase component II [Rarobacter incanus]TQK76644.1 para-aminobenzoate synthetase component 2 [Rarobacter incanus]